MEDYDDGSVTAFGAALPPPPAHVSLSPFPAYASPNPRRLSSCFSEPSRPVLAARKLAWVSLQGRLVGADEAASARAIGGGLSREETVVWELFSPLHRVLIVAVVAVAVAESKKSRQIGQLRRSVDVRDRVLLSMQQKLDDLCEQINSTKDPLRNHGDKCFTANDQSMADEILKPVYNCKHCILELNPKSGIVPFKRNPSNDVKDASSTEFARDEMFMAYHENLVEQEERRMSDLSDLCSSVTSSMDIQLNALAAEQDIYNLRKECEEKDAAIKELAAVAHASNVASSRRITELEDIIRRKNMVITKLKKDMVVLEQKVVQITRLWRPSFATSNSSNMQLPVMSNNPLYDMSSTSSSSSDSDCPAKNRERLSQSPVLRRDHDNYPQDCIATIGSKKTSAKAPFLLGVSSERLQQQQYVSPLKENHMTRRADSPMVLRLKQSESSRGNSKRTRMHIHQDSKRTMPQRRWV